MRMGAGLVLLVLAARAASAQEVPRVHPNDPHRLWRNGATWYPAGYYPAIGALTSDQQDYVNYYKVLIDKQAANRIDYFRNVFTMGQQYGDSTIPYARTGPGNAADGRPKYNLSQFNQAHFTYWRNVVSYARTKGVVIQISIMDFWHNKAWIAESNGDIQHEWGLKYDFYQGANNVNGIDVQTGAQWVDPSHPVFAVQKALVEKVIAELGDLPNIVWEVANEATVFQGAAGTAWQMQMADHITATERARGLAEHLVMPRDLPNHEMLGHCIVPEADVNTRMRSEFGRNQPLFSDND